ncbi:MAG TPA: helix-turn-helix transcriptional regulator, partial [Steroidobacteraceae bacterium]|nr:helix-turn-helix transcriptional regulator [Steroidobacteraceae bacterium]
GESYQVSHPYGSGETQLNIMFHEPLLRELVSGADPAAVDRDRIFELRQKPISLQLRFAIQAFIGALRSRDYSAAEIEETLLNLTQRMLAPATPLRRGRLTPNDRSLALRTDSLLAACYTEPVGLDILAARLNVSVYHLCRVYRRVTGKTLWSEIQQLRTRAALLHLDGGEQDLTALGLSLGFADHSHFTASFRRHLGVTPSTARQLLATGALSQVHQLLQLIG